MLSGKCIEFMLSDDSLKSLDDTDILHQRLIWICQYELQRQVASAIIKCDSLPSELKLILLFLSDYLTLDVEMEEHSTGYQEAKASQHTPNNALYFSEQYWCVRPRQAPQAISLMIRLDYEMLKLSLVLENTDDDSRFHWHD